MTQYKAENQFERIVPEISEPYPESDLGNRYILVAMDYFKKWVKTYAIPNQEALAVADVIVKDSLCRFGVSLEK